jgi:23S rRNA (uracil1939-C5)-methyltransferase
VEVVVGRGFLEEELGGLRFRIPAAGFFQVNPGAAAILHGHVMRAAGSPSHVVDLYGGVGVFGLAIAKAGARVVVIEADADSVLCGLEAADRERIPGVRFVNADALAGLQALSGGDRKPEVVIADPPRSGLGRGVATAIAGLRPARVVLIGCDPAAFSRDAGAIAKLGYRLASVQAIDLFPQTDHVEAVGTLERT